MIIRDLDTWREWWDLIGFSALHFFANGTKKKLRKSFGHNQTAQRMIHLASVLYPVIRMQEVS